MKACIKEKQSLEFARVVYGYFYFEKLRRAEGKNGVRGALPIFLRFWQVEAAAEVRCENKLLLGSVIRWVACVLASIQLRREIFFCEHSKKPPRELKMRKHVTSRKINRSC